MRGNDPFLNHFWSTRADHAALRSLWDEGNKGLGCGFLCFVEGFVWVWVLCRFGFCLGLGLRWVSNMRTALPLLALCRSVTSRTALRTPRAIALDLDAEGANLPAVARGVEAVLGQWA